MHHYLISIIKWFCRRLTFNELASAVIIFHEILSGSRKDIPLKPDGKPSLLLAKNTQLHGQLPNEAKFREHGLKDIARFSYRM